MNFTLCYELDEKYYDDSWDHFGVYYLNGNEICRANTDVVVPDYRRMNEKQGASVREDMLEAKEEMDKFMLKLMLKEENEIV